MDYDSGFRLDGVLLGTDGWARPGFLPPAIPSDPKMIEIYKDNLTDAGLDISPRMVPTAEMSGDTKYLRIGTDIHPSARGDAGYNFYTRSELIERRAVTFIGQVPHSGEDGADITAAHVTLCPSEETPTTTKQLIPETETPETETPDTETPETETPETETEKEPTPTTEKPSGSSLDEETMKKVGLGLGLGLGGAALIEKVKEHRGGGSHTVNTTEPKPAPSTTAPAKATTTAPAPAPATTTSPAPSAETTTSPAPATTTSPAPKGATGRLAETGANVVWLSAAGVLVLLAGAAFLIAGRCREE